MVTTLYPDASSWLLISISVGLFIAIFILEHFRKIALGNERSTGQHGSTTECSSPGCVRCNKTRNILDRGRQRLIVFSKKNSKINNDVICSLSNDIEQSLFRFSSKDTSACTDVEIITSSPNVLFIQGLSEQSVVPLSEFPGLNILLYNCNQINLEFMHLYQSPLPETKAMWKINTTDKGKWEIAQLIDQGSFTRASHLCPLTMSFLRQISSVMDSNVFGNAAFSVVHPQTVIERHCGSTNCRIRCHLGLKVPQNCCSLEVNGTHLQWKEGGVVCFNDAFPHSVSHTGNVDSGLRVVFMVDLWHPDISKEQRTLIDFAFCRENDTT